MLRTSDLHITGGFKAYVPRNQVTTATGGWRSTVNIKTDFLSYLSSSFRHVENCVVTFESDAHWLPKLQAAIFQYPSTAIRRNFHCILFIYLFIYLFTYLLTHLLIRKFIHSFIYFPKSTVSKGMGRKRLEIFLFVFVARWYFTKLCYLLSNHDMNMIAQLSNNF